jgi:hypothetical protein
MCGCGSRTGQKSIESVYQLNTFNGASPVCKSIAMNVKLQQGKW